MAAPELIQNSEKVESYNNTINGELANLSINTLEWNIRNLIPWEFKSL